MGIQGLYETAHVSPLEMMGQIDCQLDRGDCPLLRMALVTDTDRIAQVFDPYAVDWYLPVIGQILRVGKVCIGHEEKV
jgi:hypothetical protein